MRQSDMDVTGWWLTGITKPWHVLLASAGVINVLCRKHKWCKEKHRNSHSSWREFYLEV